MPGSLQCNVCGKAILSRKDLVVTNRAFTQFLTFHEECFKKALKTGKLVGRPANTVTSDIALAIILVTALVFYILTRKALLLLVLVASPIYRIIVWWRFERQLKS